MSCSVAQSTFTALEARYSYEHTNEMYQELLKRLDDSNDEVRIAVCASAVCVAMCVVPCVWCSVWQEDALLLFYCVPFEW
jgi:hypothetical protein